MDRRPNLLELSPPELRATLEAHFEARNQPAYRAEQVVRWLFEGRVDRVEDMTNLPRLEREALGEAFHIGQPEVAHVVESKDGTVKHLWRLHDGEVIESVLIPTSDRLTLCVSSQAGCALGCTFCATGWSGFRRQLTPGEIVGQYRASSRWAERAGRPRITNLVFMGMGEPLANRTALFSALTLLNGAYGVGARRITVSTVGMVPGIEALARRPEQFRLALSLHAPVSELRRTLIPLEKRYPLDQVMEALRSFNRAGGRRITFEYTMIRDINDDPGLIPALVRLAKDVDAFVNLIPFNPIPFQPWRPSQPERISLWEGGLVRAGIPVAVRQPRGRDIDAACGQLRATQLGFVPESGLRAGSASE